MKKILSVSILAVLAVAPLSARADVIDVPGVADATSNGMVNGVATTNYVKGAYNALQAPVANIVNAMTVDVDEGTHYISDGTDVATNLEALDAAAVANAAKIGITAIADTGALQGFNSDLSTAVNRLNSQLGTAGSNSQVSSNQDHVKTTNTVGQNLDALDDAVSKVALADDTNTKIKNTYNASGELTTTVSQNLVNLDTAVRQEIADRTAAIGTTTHALLNSNASVGTNLDALATDVATLNANTTVEAGDLPSSGTNYITATADAAANLVRLNAQLRTVTDNLANANGASTLDADKNYIFKNNSVAANLIALDTQVKANSDHIGNAATGLTGTNAGVTDLVTAINNVDNKVLTVYSGWNNGAAPDGNTTVGLANSNPATTPTPGA